MQGGFAARHPRTDLQPAVALLRERAPERGELGAHLLGGRQHLGARPARALLGAGHALGVLLPIRLPLGQRALHRRELTGRFLDDRQRVRLRAIRLLLRAAEASPLAGPRVAITGDLAAEILEARGEPRIGRARVGLRPLPRVLGRCAYLGTDGRRLALPTRAQRVDARSHLFDGLRRYTEAALAIFVGRVAVRARRLDRRRHTRLLAAQLLDGRHHRRELHWRRRRRRAGALQRFARESRRALHLGTEIVERAVVGRPHLGDEALQILERAAVERRRAITVLGRRPKRELAETGLAARDRTAKRVAIGCELRERTRDVDAGGRRRCGYLRCHGRRHRRRRRVGQRRPDRLAAVRPLENALDARHQPFASEGLHHVVVRADAEAAGDVVLAVVRRQHQDGDEGGAHLRPQTPADLEAVHARHRDVEDHDVGPLAARDLESVWTVLGREHGEPEIGVLEGVLDDVPDRRGVVDHQRLEAAPAGRRVDDGRSLVDRRGGTAIRAAHPLGIERLGAAATAGAERFAAMRTDAVVLRDLFLATRALRPAALADLDDALELFDGREARPHLADGVLEQRVQAFGAGLLAHHALAGAGLDELGHGRRHRQHLVDAETRAVAGVAALRAADVHLEGGALRIDVELPLHLRIELGRFATGRAQLAHQPLRDHQVHRGRDRVRLESEIDEACDGTGGVVGVDRAEDEVPRAGGLERDLRRFLVADLTEQDDVGILAQHRAQHAPERQPLLLVDLDLVDALELILDRVLDRDDVRLRREDLAQERIERGGLAAPGRAGDEDHALRLLRGVAKQLQVVRREAQAIEDLHALAGVENAERDLFAVLRGQARHAHVDALVRVPHLDAAVLRQAALGDVELRHHLQTRDQGILNPLREAECLFEDAVDAIAHQHRVGLRLDVDVARPRLDALDQHLVGELDDGRQLGVGGDRPEVSAIVAELVHHQGLAGRDELQELLERLLEPIGMLERVLHLVVRGDDGLHALAGGEFDGLQALEVERVGGDDLDRALVDADRHDLVAAGDGFLQLARDVRVERIGGEIDDAEPQRLGEHQGQILLTDDRLALEHVVEAGALLLEQRLDPRHLLGRDPALAGEKPQQGAVAGGAFSGAHRTLPMRSCPRGSSIVTAPPLPITRWTFPCDIFGHFARGLEQGAGQNLDAVEERGRARNERFRAPCPRSSRNLTLHGSRPNMPWLVGRS